MRRAFLAALLAGCSSRAEKGEPAPAPDVKTVALLPFLDRSGAGVDVGALADLFASELVRAGGFRVVRHRDVEVRTGEDALRAAWRAKADAVVVAAVTDFDPYTPPRVGLSIQVFRAAVRSLSDAEVDRLIQSASWRQGPLSVSRSDAPHWGGSFERVYDGGDLQTRARVAAYAAGRAADGGFEPVREVLAVNSRFLQFVSHEVIRELFAPR